MTRPALSLSIHQPCHERWSDMTPDERGRFCSSCRKTVTDFTSLTDNEIAKAVREGGDEICGRFFSHQLDRRIIETQIRKNNFRLNAAFTAFFFAASAAALSAQSSGQVNQTVVIDENHPTGPVCIRQIPAPAHVYKLDAIVVDSTSGKPCANTKVQVGTSQLFATTDSTGHFILEIPDSLVDETVKLHFMFPDQEVRLADYVIPADKIELTREIYVEPYYIIIMGRVSPIYRDRE